jgi:hypothetical protein
MFAKAVHTFHRALLLVALAVALTATGFAHRMPAAADEAQDSALAFALANGATASDFCGSLPGSDRSGSFHCPACQITASADLPPVAGKLITLELAFHAQVITPRETVALRSILDPAHAPQGPPTA